MTKVPEQIFNSVTSKLEISDTIMKRHLCDAQVTGSDLRFDDCAIVILLVLCVFRFLCDVFVGMFYRPRSGPGQ